MGKWLIKEWETRRRKSRNWKYSVASFWHLMVIAVLRIYLPFPSSCCSEPSYIIFIVNIQKIIYEMWTSRLCSIYLQPGGWAWFHCPQLRSPHPWPLPFPTPSHLPCITSLCMNKKPTLLCCQLTCEWTNWEVSLHHFRYMFTEKFISDHRPGLQPPKWEKPSTNLNLSERSFLVAFIAGEDKVMIFLLFFCYKEANILNKIGFFKQCLWMSFSVLLQELKLSSINSDLIFWSWRFF